MRTNPLSMGLAGVVVLCLAVNAPAQSVLVYNPLPSGNLQWYSGYAALNITSVDAATWSGMTTAQFAAFDMIWIGGGDVGGVFAYDALWNTRSIWSPAITGRAVVNNVHAHAGIHATPGAMTLINDIATWLVAGAAGTTSLYVDTEMGLRGFDFMEQFGLDGCPSTNCFQQNTVNIDMPSHPAMMNSTTATLSGWNWSTHARITNVPPGWIVLASGPLGETVIIARTLGCSINSPVAGSTVAGPVNLQFDVIQESMLPVFAAFEHSLDGGTTWFQCTAALGSPLMNPDMLSVLTGEQFHWDSDADMVGVGSATQVSVRVILDDGLTGTVCEVEMSVDTPTQLCGGICGDCNLNGLGPDIIDALTAAQIAVGLLVPTTEQFACCDVNISGTLDVIDALFIAQVAVVLPVVLMCA